MRARSKLCLAGLTASLLMSLAVSSASANRISITNPRYRTAWSSLRFLDGGGVSRLTCQVTIEGSFHSATIRKIRGALAGFMTTARVHDPSCTGGGATILNESLPWHITFDSFTGTLPSLSGIVFLAHDLAFRIDPGRLGLACLYSADATHRARGTVNVTQPGGGANTSTADTTIRLLRQSGSGLCPTEGGFEGIGQVFLQGNTSRISVTLI
jgi:hypothetical protein